MKKRIFDTGEFVVWKGKIYRLNSYLNGNEFELFDVNDMEKRKPLCRIATKEADDRYNQFAQCDIRNVRYTAHSVEEDTLQYKAHFCGNDFCFEKIEQCNEIWLERRRFGKEKEVETIWLRPSCTERPSQQKFYAEPMQDGRIMESHISEILSFSETEQILEKTFGGRIHISRSEADFLDAEECYASFVLDGHLFSFNEDCWGIVSVRPKDKECDALVHEIVNALNQSTQ